MVQSLLSRVRGEPPPADVSGCSRCGLIYSFDAFLWKENDTGKRCCPVCGCRSVTSLGTLPNFIEDDGFYLIGDDGFCTGPYKDEEDAQGHLWEWFVANKERAHGEEEGKGGGEKDKAGAKGRLRVFEGGKVRYPSLDRADVKGQEVGRKGTGEEGE
jgi:hypothetical protein